MLCDFCKKNKAVVHYAEVINDKVKKLNLCEECAAAKGIGTHPPFSIGELLSGLTPSNLVSKTIAKTMCSACGMTFAKFKETGRLGCDKCYETFNKSLIPLLTSIHKSSRHAGKVPSGEMRMVSTITKIRELEGRLNEAVRREEYELAAKLRDEIRAMEKKANEKEGVTKPKTRRRGKGKHSKD